MDPIFISASRIGDDDLNKVIDGLAAARQGEMIIVDKFTKVSCKDDQVMAALYALFGEGKLALPAPSAPVDEHVRLVSPPGGGGFLPGLGAVVVDAATVSPTPAKALPSGEKRLSEPFEQIRDQVNHEIDKVVDAVEKSIYPPERKKPIKLKSAPRREMRAWQVMISGQVVETITISEKNRRLASGDFETGTVLRHPKAGRQKITGEKGAPQGMVPA